MLLLEDNNKSTSEKCQKLHSRRHYLIRSQSIEVFFKCIEMNICGQIMDIKNKSNKQIDTVIC